jgi:hypothetical protein
MNEGKQRLEPLVSHDIDITKDNWKQHLGEAKLVTYAEFIRIFTNTLYYIWL